MQIVVFIVLLLFVFAGQATLNGHVPPGVVGASAAAAAPWTWANTISALQWRFNPNRIPIQSETIGYHQVSSSSLRPSTPAYESERSASGGRHWPETRLPNLW